MSIRLWSVLACLIAVLALPAAASAHRHSGYTNDEQSYTGDDGQPYEGDAGWPGSDAAPAAPAPVAPAPVVPEQDAPFEPEQDQPYIPDEPALPIVPATKGTVSGKVAMLRTDGKAAIPRGAPARVRAMIAAANQIVGKPYKWGGGHAKLIDSGYDCSGAVSYSLIGARVLGGSMVSGSLARWGAHGGGRWMTVYANAGHVYMEVAGLRFDTSPVGDPTGRSGVRWRPLIGQRRGFHARHVVGL
jgi:cell wall-associated NlpC family hydrolase